MTTTTPTIRAELLTERVRTALDNYERSCSFARQADQALWAARRNLEEAAKRHDLTATTLATERLSVAESVARQAALPKLGHEDAIAIRHVLFQTWERFRRAAERKPATSDAAEARGRLQARAGLFRLKLDAFAKDPARSDLTPLQLLEMASDLLAHADAYTAAFGDAPVDVVPVPLSQPAPRRWPPRTPTKAEGTAGLMSPKMPGFLGV